MTEPEIQTFDTEIVDAQAIYTLEELCIVCHVEADWVAELIEFGVLDTHGQPRADWQFAGLSVVRVAKAKRLERDLSLNPPGIALVFDLLERIDALQAHLGPM